MATQAEQIVESGAVPGEWEDGAEEVRAACKQAHASLDDVDVSDPVHEVAANHGLHAYRYEVCDDGSVVALWANTKRADLKLKAFENMEEASLWSPRDER